MAQEFLGGDAKPFLDAQDIVRGQKDVEVPATLGKAGKVLVAGKGKEGSALRLPVVFIAHLSKNRKARSQPGLLIALGTCYSLSGNGLLHFLLLGL